MNLISLEEYDSLISDKNNKKQCEFYCCFPLYWCRFNCKIDFFKNGNDYIQGLKCFFK